jgi:hypothetical protein
MPSSKPVAATLALAVSALAFANPAEAGHRFRHHHNDLAVGAIGFAAGAILGGALASPRYSAPYYYEQAPVYVAPSPVYVAPEPVYVAPRVYPGPVYYSREPWSEGWYSYCGQRYRSFDLRTGYFMGYDGRAHFCQ